MTCWYDSESKSSLRLIGTDHRILLEMFSKRTKARYVLFSYINTIPHNL
jgi:hypothetical protein